MTHDGADTKAEKDQSQKRQRGVEDDRAPEAKNSGRKKKVEPDSS